MGYTATGKWALLMMIMMVFPCAKGWLDEDLAYESLDIGERGKLTIGYGASALEESKGERKVYFTAQARPEFILKDATLGLDLSVHFDGNGGLRKRGWDSSSNILEKIDYLWIGNSTSFRRFRIGNMRQLTMGEGFLVRKFANRPLYPLGKKSQGFEGGFVLPHRDSISFFLDDLERPSLMGARLDFDTWEFARISFDFLSDRNPWDTKGDHSSINAFAGEIFSPLWGDEKGRLGIYQNLGRISTNQVGWATGLKFDVGNFLARTEYRYHDNGFRPGYFGNHYALDKSYQRQWMEDAPKGKKSSIRLELGYDSFVNFKANGGIEKFAGEPSRYYGDFQWGPKYEHLGNIKLNMAFDSAVPLGLDHRELSFDTGFDYELTNNAAICFNIKRLLDADRKRTATGFIITQITF